MKFDNTPYGRYTTTEAQEEIRELNNSLKDYSLLKHKNSNGDYNHLQNFFIFRYKKKSQYIRICLISEGWHDKKVFYWSVDSCFKPFTKNTQNKKFKSQFFKGSAEDLYLIYLNECIKFIREEVK